MKIPINKEIFELCRDEGYVEYLLDWISGYARRDAVISLIKLRALSNFIGPLITINIPDSTIKQLIRKFNLAEDDNLHSCIDILLIVALVMGGGE